MTGHTQMDQKVLSALGNNGKEGTAAANKKEGTAAVKGRVQKGATMDKATYLPCQEVANLRMTPVNVNPTFARCNNQVSNNQHDSDDEDGPSQRWTVRRE